MGCLNAGEGFEHWFGNIHLSGPCNRSCYFCIGQWMPGQDMNNNLGDGIEGLESFISECKQRGVTEVNITGTNTDPLMKGDLIPLLKRLRLEGFTNIGIRTNGVLAGRFYDVLPYIDKASVSITSFNPDIYKNTMGSGNPPNIMKVLKQARIMGIPIKLNVVLCPETVETMDFIETAEHAARLGIRKINFREPYGQTHIGDPFAEMAWPIKQVYGNPCYDIAGVECTYWDVHYTEVESVNLYADGHVSVEYPVSLGHSDTMGDVKDQSNFSQGRQKEQWKGTKSQKGVDESV